MALVTRILARYSTPGFVWSPALRVRQADVDICRYKSNVNLLFVYKRVLTQHYVFYIHTLMSKS
jgi:hypothetical protein